MPHYTDRSHRSAHGPDFPLYREADDIPLERDLRQRYRTLPSGRFEESHGYNAPLLGILTAVLGAGVALAWFGTWSRSDREGSWSHRDLPRRSVPMDETDDLIASNKVEGTAVYDRNGDKIGSVHNFMVGKRSGRVAYVVVSFGGFLGFGSGYHPLPWNVFTYDEDQGGYVVDIDKDRLKNAPRHQDNENPFSNPAYGRQVTRYWLVVQ